MRVMSDSSIISTILGQSSTECLTYCAPFGVEASSIISFSRNRRRDKRECQ
jgi:hypothetical protein